MTQKGFIVCTRLHSNYLKATICDIFAKLTIKESEFKSIPCSLNSVLQLTSTMEHTSQILAVLIVILACCAIGNCAETKVLFTSAKNNKYFVQPAQKVDPFLPFI